MIVISSPNLVEANGFSLIEIVIVISLVAVMTTLGIQNLSGAQSKLSFEQEVTKVRSLLVKARNQSLILKQTITAKFDTEKSSLTLVSQSKNSDYEAVQHKLPNGIEFQQDIKDQVSTNKTLELFFFKDGQSSGGSIKISSKTFSALIHVDWLGGDVEVIKQRQ